jgi:hypothetical protein
MPIKCENLSNILKLEIMIYKQRDRKECKLKIRENFLVEIDVG